MATSWVYVCDGTRTEPTFFGTGSEGGGCQPASAGHWQQIDLTPPPFDATAYFAANGAEWGSYFGSGFTFLAVAILTAQGVRFVLRFIAR